MALSNRVILQTKNNAWLTRLPYFLKTAAQVASIFDFMLLVKEEPLNTEREALHVAGGVALGVRGQWV